MSSTTPRLGLKKWDGSDPFLRVDFNNNSDILDASPGVYVCTSTSPPNWGSAQAGRLAWYQDQRRFVCWTGSAFVDPAASPLAYQAGALVNQNGTSPSPLIYPLGTWNVPRPGIVTAVFTFRVGSTGVSAQQAVGYGIINDSRSPDVTRGDTRWNKTNAVDQDFRQIVALQQQNVAAGPVTFKGMILMALSSPVVSISYMAVTATLTTS